MKKLPSAIELEQNIIGAILLERDAINEVADVLTPEMFYEEKHRIIYEHCLKMSMANDPIDITTISNSLKSTNELEKIGGAMSLVDITIDIVSSANIEYYTKIVMQEYVKRKEIKNSTEIIDACFDDTKDMFEIMEKAYIARDEVMQQISRKKEKAFPQLLKEVIRDIERNQATPNKGLNGITSGFADLDSITGGWQKTDLIILAARPAMGKTSNALTMAINAAKAGHPVAFFSLEMADKQIAKKAISIFTDIPFQVLKNDRLTPEDWSVLNSRINDLTSLPLYIDDTPSMTITEISAKAKRMKQKYKIEMIVVDYLQFISSSGKTKNQNRDQEVGYYSRTLKNLAKELDVPVIALAQLNRAVDTRADHEPVLSDLRESGSIEQDADIVTFLTRPEYYGTKTTELGKSTDGLADFIIAKHRNGKCDKLSLRFNKSTTGFSDYSETSDFPFNNPGVIIRRPSQMNDLDVPF